MLVKKILGENFYRKKVIQIVKCSSSFVIFVNEKFFEYIIFVSIYAELITENDTGDCLVFYFTPNYHRCARCVCRLGYLQN